MTAMEMVPAVGATVHVHFENIHVQCKVLDVKTAWGKVRLLVSPVAGRYHQWVELARLVAEPQEKGYDDNRLPQLR